MVFIIALHCQDAGPTLRDGLRVPDLQYADHDLLLASYPAELQCLIDCMAGSCSQVRLVFNEAKTSVIAFSNYSHSSSWTCSSTALGLL